MIAFVDACPTVERLAASQDSPRCSFWCELAEAYDAFEGSRIPPCHDARGTLRDCHPWCAEVDPR